MTNFFASVPCGKRGVFRTLGGHFFQLFSERGSGSEPRKEPIFGTPDPLEDGSWRSRKSPRHKALGQRPQIAKSGRARFRKYGTGARPQPGTETPTGWGHLPGDRIPDPGIADPRTQDRVCCSQTRSLDHQIGPPRSMRAVRDPEIARSRCCASYARQHHPGCELAASTPRSR